MIPTNHKPGRLLVLYLVLNVLVILIGSQLPDIGKWLWMALSVPLGMAAGKELKKLGEANRRK